MKYSRLKRHVKLETITLKKEFHGDGDHGFVPLLIGLAREKGVAAYVGEGLNRWPAVHRLDAAHIYRLVLEKGSARGGGAISKILTGRRSQMPTAL